MLPTHKAGDQVWVRAFDDGGVRQTECGELNGGYVFNGYVQLQMRSTCARAFGGCILRVCAPVLEKGCWKRDVGVQQCTC